MKLWQPSSADLKTYRHFDAAITVKEIEELVRCEQRVSRHKFMPLLHFEMKWRRSPQKQQDGSLKPQEPKIREIRYACRKDSYIFKHYREILSQLYETKLEAANLENCVLAYRRIPKVGTNGSHKSNIEFAKEAFEKIDQFEDKCCAVAVDISNFFSSMSHDIIKSTWTNLLQTNLLPEDHYSVFKALTKFRYVDRNSAFVALGYSRKEKTGNFRFNIDPRRIPTQICSNEQFRSKIVAADLVTPHDKSYGIPQGTPLSDLIANAYLFEFDVLMKKYAEKRDGFYFRYSDDILFIILGDGRSAAAAFSHAQKNIRSFGANLAIKPEKTEIVCFSNKRPLRTSYKLESLSNSERRLRVTADDGLSYLGLRYDGRKVYLRNSTVSNALGKIERSIKAAAINHVDRHMNKSLAWLLRNAPTSDLLEHYFQIRDFEETVSKARASGSSPFSNMTFFLIAK